VKSTVGAVCDVCRAFPAGGPVGAGEDECATWRVLQQMRSEGFGVAVGHRMGHLNAPADIRVRGDVQPSPPCRGSRFAGGDLVVAPAGGGVGEPGHLEADGGEVLLGREQPGIVVRTEGHLPGRCGSLADEQADGRGFRGRDLGVPPLALVAEADPRLVEYVLPGRDRDRDARPAAQRVACQRDPLSRRRALFMDRSGPGAQ
jgi:hypothetical protein